MAMSRGQPRDVIRAAANQAVRDAIFLVELVLEINAAAADLVQTADLRVTALAWQLRALQAEASRTPKAAATAGWRAWRDDVAALVGAIDAAELARARLEHQYLDGHGALFGELSEDLVRIRGELERLVEAGQVTTLVRRRGRGGDADAAAEHQAPALIARIVDAVRVATLDLLGEGPAAGALAARRYRAVRDAAS